MNNITDIIGLNAYTSNGDRLDVTKIKGSPIVGSPLENKNGVWHVTGVNSDSECASGVCKVR